MRFNRINGFYCGNWSTSELREMSIDEQNQEVNEALDSRLSQLNELLAEKEAELAAMRVVRDAAFAYRAVEDLDEQGQIVGEHMSRLGMIKWRSGWRLCISHEYWSYSGGPEPDSHWRPVSECTIDERMDALKHWEKLKAMIVAEKAKLIPELEKVIGDAAGRTGE